MFTVYAISSEIKTYVYVEMSSNLQERLHRHNSGYEKTTRPYLPFRLIYFKEFLTRGDARANEKYLKKTEGRRKLKIL